MTERRAGDQPEVGFERTDVDAGSLLKAGFYVVAITTAVIFFLAWLYGLFVAQEAARQPPPPVMRPDAAALAPPPPLLQTAPAQDLAAFRAQEDIILGSYGWVDKEAKLVRIPIEEAMRIVAEKGLPVLGPAPTPSPGGAVPGRTAEGQ
jgi:hypothetical protein